MHFELNENRRQDHRRRPGKRRSWLEIILLVGFILCLLIGAASLGAFWLLYQGTEPTMPDTELQTFRAQDIVPQLALMELAGDSPNALAHQALNAGEIDTAYAIALFDIGSDGSNLVGLWLQLGRGYQQRGEPIQALTAYRRVYALAIFDDTLSPVERGQLLAQVGRGLLDLEQVEEARHIVVQAKRLGEQYPGLLPTQRSQIFNGLRPLVGELNDAFLENQIGELIRNPYLTPASFLVADALSEPASALLKIIFPVAQPALSAELQTAVSVRQSATRRLVDQLNMAAQQGADNTQFIETERTALAQALLQEESRRDEYFQRMEQGLPIEEQLRLLYEKRSWLVLKMQGGLSGFGQSIVPNWTEQMAGENISAEDDNYLHEIHRITGQLDTAWETLIESRMGEQVSSRDRALLRVQILRWLALQIELGLYPENQAQNISSRFDAAQDEATRLGVPVALPIRYESQAIPPGFSIQPLE